jgi:tetratricopeptide (TPR) repeat protein
VTPSDAKLAFALGVVATAQSLLGHYEEGLAGERRVLSLFEENFGPDHPQVALRCIRIAIFLCYMHRYQEGLSYFERAKGILVARFSPDYLEIGNIESNIGEVYRKLGRRSEAMKHYQASVAIIEKSAPDSADLAFPLTGMGELFRISGELEKAMRNFVRAKRLFEKAKLVDQWNVADPIAGMAAVYLARHDQKRAISLYEEALQIREKALPPEHLDLAESRFALARALRGQNGQSERALQLASQARAAYLKCAACSQELSEVENWLSRH